MSKKKFKETDVLINTMRTHPLCEFFIFDGKAYYNSTPEQSGTFNKDVKGVEPGFISLFEYNIDRKSAADVDAHPSNDIIFPFITKDSSGGEFKTVSDTSASTMWTTASLGDVLYGTYPFSASISREYWSKAGDRHTVKCASGDPVSVMSDCEGGPHYPHYWAMKNRLNFYGSRSRHYLVSSSQVTADGRDTPGMAWDKDDQIINFISIPSIFFGSKIEPGSVSLKWFFTGSLSAELQDKKRNGELIQVSGGSHATAYNDKVAGVILYDEGLILLTASWGLQPTSEKIRLISGSTSTQTPKWIHWGAGMPQWDATKGSSVRVSQASTAVSNPTNPNPAGKTNYVSASFKMSFRGTSETQVMTMFAHAKKGEANYSNNPTYLSYVTSAFPAPDGTGPGQVKLSSSYVYEENSDRTITNFVSSSFTEYSASFKRQVYISRIALYDSGKNLIGVATLANPVLKQEDQDFTFKLRYDI
mgnify:CR=1 FL=1